MHLVGLGSGPDVSLSGGNVVDGEALGEDVLGILLLHAGNDHAGPALTPIHWSSNLKQ